jgi:hypothetical protein
MVIFETSNDIPHDFVIFEPKKTLVCSLFVWKKFFVIDFKNENLF